MRLYRFGWIWVTALAAGCGVPGGEAGDDEALATAGEALTPAQEDGIVAAVNCGCTTVEALRAADVPKRAAVNLVARRDGPDGRFGTADDRPFATFEEIDAVRYVGPVTVRRLLNYASANGFVVESDDALIGVWDGVPFTAAEAEATLRLANTASFEVLTDEIGLRSNAARNIIAARPLASLEALSAVRYVGPAALRALKAHASPEPDRPDLNRAPADVLAGCDYVGPVLAEAIVDYRTRFGALETYEEVGALRSFGYRVVVSGRTVESLRGCFALAGERRRVTGVTVADLLADPGAYVGAIVELRDVVPTGYLSSRRTRSMRLFDFSEWGYADWDAAGVPADRMVDLVVEPRPEMYRRASTRYEARVAYDTRLNVGHVTGIVEAAAGGIRVRVRRATAPGRDLIEIDRRWLPAERVAGLASLWSRENGVVRTTRGGFVNRVPAALLNVHPAVLWHTATTGESVDVGRRPECYDCATNPYTDDGRGLFRQYVEAWRAAGRP